MKKKLLCVILFLISSWAFSQEVHPDEFKAGISGRVERISQIVI